MFCCIFCIVYSFMVITYFACKSNSSFQIIKPLQAFFLKFVAKLWNCYEVYLRSTSFF
jgi:hypothetical protein